MLSADDSADGGGRPATRHRSRGGQATVRSVVVQRHKCAKEQERTQEVPSLGRTTLRNHSVICLGRVGWEHRRDALRVTPAAARKAGIFCWRLSRLCARDWGVVVSKYVPPTIQQPPSRRDSRGWQAKDLSAVVQNCECTKEHTHDHPGKSKSSIEFGRREHGRVQ